MTDQNLTEYIQNALKLGTSKDQIYKDLLVQGSTLQAIDEHMALARQPDAHKRTVNIILVFGAILIGAGIFSFIASNWTGMPSTVKVLVILLAMTLFYGLGWFFQEELHYPRSAEAFFILGAITYGAGIYLVAQIFNIRVNWPDGMLLWLLGTVAMAYALDSYPLYFLSVPLGIIGVFGYPIFLFDLFADNALIYTSTLLLVVTFGVTMFIAIRMRKKMPDELKQL